MVKYPQVTGEECISCGSKKTGLFLDKKLNPESWLCFECGEIWVEKKNKDVKVCEHQSLLIRL